MSFDVSGNVMDTATSPLSYLGSEIVAASFGASVTTTLVLVFKASATSLTDATSITFSLKAGALSSTANAILEKDEIVGGKLKSRTWNRTFAGAKITELWENSTEESVGGYKIISLKVKPIIASTYNTLDTTDISAFTTAINGAGSYNIKTIYEKTIHFPGTTKNKSIDYKVEVTRSSTINKTSSPYNIESDSIENITVELQQ
jgi:hypothetical protein